MTMALAECYKIEKNEDFINISFSQEIKNEKTLFIFPHNFDMVFPICLREKFVVGKRYSINFEEYEDDNK